MDTDCYSWVDQNTNHIPSDMSSLEIIRAFYDEIETGGDFMSDLARDAVDDALSNGEVYSEAEYAKIEEEVEDLKETLNDCWDGINITLHQSFKMKRDKNGFNWIEYGDIREVATDLDIIRQKAFSLKCEKDFYKAKYESIKESIDEDDMTLMMEKVMDKTSHIAKNDIIRVEEIMRLRHKVNYYIERIIKNERDFIIPNKSDIGPRWTQITGAINHIQLNKCWINALLESHSGFTEEFYGSDDFYWQWSKRITDMVNGYLRCDCVLYDDFIRYLDEENTLIRSNKGKYGATEGAIGTTPPDYSFYGGVDDERYEKLREMSCHFYTEVNEADKENVEEDLDNY